MIGAGPGDVLYLCGRALTSYLNGADRCARRHPSFDRLLTARPRGFVTESHGCVKASRVVPPWPEPFRSRTAAFNEVFTEGYLLVTCLV